MVKHSCFFSLIFWVCVSVYALELLNFGYLGEEGCRVGGNKFSQVVYPWTNPDHCRRTVQNRLQNRLFGILGVLDSLVLPVLCRSWKVVARAFNQTEKFDDALLGEAASQLQAARKSVV